MGEWYEYRLRCCDTQKDLTEMLIRDQYASFIEDPREHDTTIRIDISKIDDQICGEVINGRLQETQFLGRIYCKSPEEPLDHINIGKDNTGFLHYVNKWTPNLALPLAFSVLYPEEVIEAREYTPYYDKDNTSYIKNGSYCNREGVPITHQLFGLNPKLIRENQRDGQFRFSLPIGEADDRWGTISVKESNISPLYGYESNQIYAYNGVYFTEETPVTIAFRNRTITMTPEELILKYKDSIREYRDYAREQMVLENVPEENIRSIGSDGDMYYIVGVHVPTDVSSNGVLSFTASLYEVTDGTDGKNVNLGDRKKDRCCRKDGDTRTPYYVSNEKVKEYYDNNPQLELEDDREM